jgi:hypothetical protein
VVLSDEELATPAPDGAWLLHGVRESAEIRPRPWSELLSAALVDALQEWNDEGGRLFHYAEPDRDAEDGEKKEDAFRARAKELAAWTQRELGAEYEVLFVTVGGTWQRAEPPWSTAC